MQLSVRQFKCNFVLLWIGLTFLLRQSQRGVYRVECRMLIFRCWWYERRKIPLKKRILRRRGETPTRLTKNTFGHMGTLPLSRMSANVAFGKHWERRYFCVKLTAKAYEYLTSPYYADKKPWITKDIFSDWFHTHFAPAARVHCKEVKLYVKLFLILLLLDNSSVYSPARNAVPFYEW